jgi:Na+-transporting methylmalonyl-CoA/oxaloacetate decarboxylase beta subunit
MNIAKERGNTGMGDRIRQWSIIKHFVLSLVLVGIAGVAARLFYAPASGRSVQIVGEADGPTAIFVAIFQFAV